MIARVDHRALLVALAALAVALCVLVVGTLLVGAQAVPSSGPGTNPDAHPSVVDMHRTMNCDRPLASKAASVGVVTVSLAG